MWPDGSQPGLGEQGARASTGSEVVTIDERAVTAAREVPSISSLNVTRSSRVHVGPKFVSVTQNVHNTEVIKGRFLGLELVSPKANRLRCSIAVFVCWALVVASGLFIYLVCFAMPKLQTRLDIDLAFPQYIWQFLKNTTRAERLFCTAAILLIIACASLIVYFVSKPKMKDVIDVAPHEWRITRDMWQAKAFNNSDVPYDNPVKLVVIQHTVSTRCHLFVLCASELRNLQDDFIEKLGYDIPYNFIVGNDGRVYEGRGWRKEGAHTKGFNRCSLGIGFIGDYREEINPHSKVTQRQLNSTEKLLEEGVRLGYLDPNYLIVGAKDLQATASPGSHLYKAIRKNKHYDTENRFRDMHCDQINSMPINSTAGGRGEIE